jgi:hypothetical protein
MDNKVSAGLLLSTCLAASGCADAPIVYKPVEVPVEYVTRCTVKVDLPKTIDIKLASNGVERVRILIENNKRLNDYATRADKALAECRGDLVKD